MHSDNVGKPVSAEPANCRIRRNDQVMSSRRGGDTVICHVDRGTYFTVRNVAARVWELIAEGVTFDTLVTTIAAEYNVTRGELVKDLTEFASILRFEGLVCLDD